MKTHLKIVASYIICHLISYFAVSIPYYHLVMKGYYSGVNAPFAKFLVTESNTELWIRAMSLFFPVQILSAVLFSVLLISLYDWMLRQSFLKSVFIVFWCKGIIGGLASVLPSPGTLEGYLFMIPEITNQIHILVAIEVSLQALLIAILFNLILFRLWKSKH
ncbi:MAG: hypothetical protein SH817_03650 [Leptospira sp.]|nr:hypothetical protein [Leptospira sp.]